MAPKMLKRPASATLSSSHSKKKARTKIPVKRPAASDNSSRAAVEQRPAFAEDQLNRSAVFEANNASHNSKKVPTEMELPSSSSSRSSPGRSGDHRLREDHSHIAGRSTAPAPQLMIKNAPENPTQTKGSERQRIGTLQEERQRIKDEQVKVVRGIAVPTENWQVIPKGVACPAGCEYRMNMSSGVNMVRLLQSGVKSGVKSDGALSTGALVAASSVRARHEQVQLRQQQVAGPQRPATSSPGASRSSSTPAQRVVQDAPPMTRAAFTAQLRQEVEQQRAKRAQVPSSSSRASSESAARSLKRAPQVLVQDPKRTPSSSSKLVPQATIDLTQEGSSGTKVVDKEYKRRRVDTDQSGMQKEAKEHVRSRALVRRGESGKLTGEKKTLRKEESVRKLEDGRTVVTETVTLQKVTVLSK